MKEYGKRKRIDPEWAIKENKRTNSAIKKKANQNPQLFKKKDAKRRKINATIKLSKYSMMDRYINFKESIQFGLSFNCICCHRRCFKSGGLFLSRDFLTKVIENFSENLEESVGETDIEMMVNKFMCLTCKTKMEKGDFPSMSHRNGLELVNLEKHEELQLSELENCLIALNILFQIFYLLPKSRYRGIRDRIVNVPVYEEDVIKTIKTFPRTPDEAGIVPVIFKRKLGYSHGYLEEYINTRKLFKALATLKELGHPYYQFPFQTEEEYIERLMENKEIDDSDGDEDFVPDHEESSSSDSNYESDTTKEKNEHNSTRALVNENDATGSSKWSFDYEASTAFANDIPEISVPEERKDETVAVAPGEGKKPTNILSEKDWDIKSYPGLYPDGKFGLHFPRKKKISDQNFFIQRIMNKDLRFANNMPFIFASVAYIEKLQIERNINISFMRGKKTENVGGPVYSLEDAYSVLDNIKNTPRYWRKAKYELVARLENFGPFVFFFTLSSGDKRFPENFISHLQDHEVLYKYDGGEEEVYIDDQPLHDYLAENVNLHEFIKKNIVTATINFHKRVRMFIKHIVMAESNPMKVKYYSFKTEFQQRGSGHIHGVLWLDWETLALNKENNFIVKAVKSAFNSIKMDKKLTCEEECELVKFADTFVSCSRRSQTTGDTVDEVNTHHHTHSCRKYDTPCRFHFPRFPVDRTLISIPARVAYPDEKIRKKEMTGKKETLMLVKSILENSAVMEKINKHRKKELEEICRAKKTLHLLKMKSNLDISDITLLKSEMNGLPKLYPWKKQEQKVNVESVKKMVLDAKVTVDNLLIIEKEIFSERLLHVLLRAGITNSKDPAIIMKTYEDALQISDHGYSIHHRRNTDEIFVNQYNEEWLYNWNANLDFQLCLDYFAVLTYISDYWMKDDTGTTKFIKEALAKAEGDKLKDKLRTVANTFLKNRQMGPCEALYRGLPFLHLKESNSDCVFLPTGFKESRSKFLKKLTEDEENSHSKGITVEGKEGLYVEKPSLLDKYCRRDVSKNQSLKNISYSQFCQRYSACKKTTKDFKFTGDIYADEDDIKQKNYVITAEDPVAEESYVLPKYIMIQNPEENEPGFMRLRTPMVVRFTKFNRLKKPHEYKLSQLQLFHPFITEEELFPSDQDQCESLFNELDFDGNLKLKKVKAQVLEHMDDVQEARENTESIIDLAAIGEQIDPENEQVEGDCELEGFIEDPRTLQTELDNEEENSGKKRKDFYRKIELSSEEELKEMIDACDEDQRMIIDIATTYARSWKKSIAGISSPNKAPLLIVQGGAGSGKSRVIKVISEVMENIFRTAGDDINYPYILITAPTGTAAANVNGHTLCSAFSLSWGVEFYSLTDKKRDQKRTELKNLKVVIIDEISMVDPDTLYKIHLRLQEIKQVPTKPFGGIAVFVFGDLMQLKPVRAPFIFEKPRNPKFVIPFRVDSLWEKFQSVILRTNHRQAADREYADILNRIQQGNILDEDYQLLQTRIIHDDDPNLPGNALYVACTNQLVNHFNNDKLSRLEEEEITSVAKVERSGQNLKPIVENTGAIRNTPLQHILKMKKNARVMLTYNIDTIDSLTNGTFGQIVDFLYFPDKSIKTVLVEFDDFKSGEMTRKVCRNVKYKNRRVTPIERIELSYNLSKNSNTSTSGIVQQFPLKLAFAATAHKVQGQTVRKPGKLILDLNSVREAGQAYVMLSRVTELSQLYIINTLNPDKIYHNKEAEKEVKRLSETALKNFIGISRSQVILSVLNVRSLRNNFHILQKEMKNLSPAIICLQETWLKRDYLHVKEFNLEGMTLCLNNVGRGRGIATYMDNTYQWKMNLTCESFQISVITSVNRVVINIYRSADSDSKSFDENLFQIIRDLNVIDTEVFLCGDFNLCYLTNVDIELFQKLNEMKFVHIVKKSTHEKGRLIDQVFVLNAKNSYSIIHQSIPFLDHDILHVINDTGI